MPRKRPGELFQVLGLIDIEITTLTKEESDRYVVDGFVIDITSVEVVNGGAATKTPVHVVAQRVQGHWLITDYTEER